MALTVHLTSTDDHREIRPGVPTLVFETDGICCFFEPAFNALGEATGKYVDPWDGGAFSAPGELDALARVFAEAAREIRGLPETLSVKTGTRGDPPEELREEVLRTDLERLVAGILGFAARARREGLCVYFYGD